MSASCAAAISPFNRTFIFNSSSEKGSAEGRSTGGGSDTARKWKEKDSPCNALAASLLVVEQSRERWQRGNLTLQLSRSFGRDNGPFSSIPYHRAL